jgi:hypothetical protein
MTDHAGIDAVHHFWAEVWQPPHNYDAIDDLVTEDFVLVTGGRRIESRAAFKEWAKGFGAAIHDFRFDVVETFQSQDGSRVASLWRVTGRNNGVFGSEPDDRPVDMCGTAVWTVREDGMLTSNRVERNALEVFRALTTH